MKKPAAAKLPAYTISEQTLQAFDALAQVVASEASTRIRHTEWEAEMTDEDRAEWQARKPAWDLTV